MLAMRREKVKSRWWRPKRDASPYRPGWLANSGAPYRVVQDLDGIIHFCLADPKTYSDVDARYQNHPGYTGCDIEFQWTNSAVAGLPGEPVIMRPSQYRRLTCVLCIGAF